MAGSSPSANVRPLCVRLFGTPHVSYDGKPVRFLAARTLPLFAYLVLKRERPIARDRLAYKFWPDCSENDARANLRRHLHRVNGPLFEVSGHRWLEANDKSIAFDPLMPLDLDVARLDAASHDPAAAVDAIELYTGDLFEGCDDEWLIPHRERLRTAFLALLFGVVDRYRGERRFAEAIALAHRALHVDPFREDVLRTLMSLHYESGDRASALGEYRTFRERLQLEFGADPMRETQSLHDAIRRHAAVGTRAIDRPSPERALPFSGREFELEALHDAWQQAAGGRGRVVFISGEAGIGKTRLLREFATLTEREGARVLWGASSAPEAEPYEPVTEALASAISEVARLSLSPALIGALAVRFPELRAMRPDIPDSVGLVAQRERERFFDAIALAIKGLCGARPTVVVFEDAHWAHSDTFELIAHVVRTCANASFLAIVSFREDHQTSALRSLRFEPVMKPATRIGLGRLEPAACREIVATGFANVPPSVADWAIDLADGNPLFLGELVREHRVRRNDDLPLAGTLPTSLESAILARLSNLSEAARTLLDIAAVGGTIATVDVLQHASGWPLREVLDATDELVDRFLLRETATGSRGDYQFAHELIRDAVLRSMPAEVRIRRHRRFARALLQIYPGRQDEFARALAQHFEQAGQREDAARSYARAASVARDRFAWQDVITFAEHALRLEEERAERFALHAAIESAAMTSGDGDRRKHAIATMLALADERDDDGLRAIALARSSEYGLQTGDAERQRQATDRLEALATASRNPALLRQALRCRARGEIAFGRAARAVETLGAIDGIEGLERSASERIEDLHVLAFARAATADFDAARTAMTEAERLAGPEATLAERIAIVRTRATIALETADRKEAARLAPVLLELCAKIGDLEGEGNAHQVAARIDWWAFDVASAREHLSAATSLFERIGKPQSRAATAINAGALENHVGLLDDAERFYAAAQSIAEQLENALQRSLCHGNFAYAALLRGDGERALAEAERALSLARVTNDRRLTAIDLGLIASALHALERDAARSLASFAEALDLCETFGFVDERLELIADMIPALVARGMHERAAAYGAELERAIGADASAVVMPVDALAKAASAFEASGDDAAARATREHAGRLLRDRLARLPDARTRAAYAALPAHRALADAAPTGARNP